MVEAQPRLALHAAEEQREERQHHEHDERENGAAHDDVLELQPRAQGGRARLEGSVTLATFVVIAIVSAPRAPVYPATIGSLTPPRA